MPEYRHTREFGREFNNILDDRLSFGKEIDQPLKHQ